MMIMKKILSASNDATNYLITSAKKLTHTIHQNGFTSHMHGVFTAPDCMCPDQDPDPKMAPTLKFSTR